MKKEESFTLVMTAPSGKKISLKIEMEDGSFSDFKDTKFIVFAMKDILENKQPKTEY